MNTILLQKNRAVEAAVWPLGRPEKAYELPMWQTICRDWVREKMQPTHVTYLIEELLKLADPSDQESTAYDIEQAVQAAANWEECASNAGWLNCDALIEELIGDDQQASDKLLLKLMCLVVQGYADTSGYADDPDYAIYWIRKTPQWDGDTVVMQSELIAWADMTDTYVAHRAAGDLLIERDTGVAPAYCLGYCHLRPSPALGVWFSDKDGLPEDVLNNAQAVIDLSQEFFVPLSQMINNCHQAVTAWIISEWLEPHGFVNFYQETWSSETTWQKLGEMEGLEDDVTQNEVSQWFIVDEFAAESLREVGAVVSDLIGSDDCLFGRTEGNQALYFDGDVQLAVVHSGYLDRVPPLGALNRDTDNLPRIRFTLGGEEFPFRIYGYSEHRPDRELDGVILDPEYREAGWCVIWGPSFESEAEGLVRKFKLSPVTPEGHPEPEYHEG